MTIAAQNTPRKDREQREPVHRWGALSRVRVPALNGDRWQIATLVFTAAVVLGQAIWNLEGSIGGARTDQIQANGTLASKLAADEARLDALSNQIQAIGALSSRISAVEARIDSLSGEINRDHSENTAFQAEMRSFNETAIQAMADLKVQVGTAIKGNTRQR